MALAKENETLTCELKKCMETEIRKVDACAEANLRQQLNIAVQVQYFSKIGVHKIINLITKEKEVVLDLWRLAVSEVTNLEKVIKILQEQKDVSFNSSSLEVFFHYKLFN